MIVTIDKKLFEVLRDMGIDCTYEQFKQAYSVRKKQRDKEKSKLDKYEAMLLDSFNKENQKNN